MTITALFWNPDLRHNGAAGFAHNKEKSHMARRNRRRSFGLSPRRNRGRRASSRRNAWSEAKTMIVKKARRHSEVARDAWTPARKKAARKSRKYKGTYGKAAPKKRAKRRAKRAAAPAAPKRRRAKRKGSRKPQAHAATRTKSRKRVKKNGRRRSRRVTRNRSRSRRVTRNRSHRRTHHNSRRRTHRNRRARRNGYAGLLMTVAGIGVGAAAASYLSSKLVDYLKGKPGEQSKIPASLVEYAPALLAAGATAAVWYGLKKFGGAKAAPHLEKVVGGGIAASLFLLAMHVKMGPPGLQESIAQKIGLLPKDTIVVTPAAGAASGYGVFGLGSNYGVFGLNGYTDVGGMVNTPGGPLAVEGVISIPGGGPLAVEGASFGGYLGSSLSDSVVGTPSHSMGPAVNPFAPGLREGNRGTMNEAHAGEVADAGSLSGNIFS